MERLSICGRIYGNNFISRCDFMEQLANIWAIYTDWIKFFFNSNWTWTTVWSVVVLVWLVSFLIFLPLHRLSLKKVLEAKKDLVNSVDRLIYLLSKAQYSLSEKQTLQFDPCFALMKTMFGTWHFEYVDNIDTIKENVKKVEILLKQRVISDEEWNKIDSQRSKLKFHLFWRKFFGYELNAVTCGIYNLFW